MIGKYKFKTPKNIWVDEFLCLRNKKYVFKWENDSKSKLKGICNSQSKNIKFEKYQNCLDGREHEKQCDNYIF